MRSRRITFRLNTRVYHETARLSKAAGYKNISRYMQSLCILAIQNERRKTWVRDMANADPSLQDYLTNKMLDWPLDAKGIAEALKKMDRAKVSPKRL